MLTTHFQGGEVLSSPFYKWGTGIQILKKYLGVKLSLISAEAGFLSTSENTAATTCTSNHKAKDLTPSELSHPDAMQSMKYKSLGTLLPTQFCTPCSCSRLLLVLCCSSSSLPLLKSILLSSDHVASSSRSFGLQSSSPWSACSPSLACCHCGKDSLYPVA